jgi:predicted TIM-barrel fold metal-dependent hydrolase
LWVKLVGKEDPVNRRDLLKLGAMASAGMVARSLLGAETEASSGPIIDAHIHVWDLKQFHLPWLDRAEPLLKRDYSVADYREAIRGTGIAGAVYIEVEVEPGQRVREAEYANQLGTQPKTLIPAAVIGGDPADAGFGKYIARFKDTLVIKGVRFPYPDGASMNEAFVKGIRALGAANMSFDLLLGPAQLTDAAKLADVCPETPFVVDHCGGGSPRLFRKSTGRDAGAERQIWKRGIEQLAKKLKVVCKISGVADSALPGDAPAEDCAPVVNFCLDQFGPDRVLFGTNWPVCLKGTTISHLVDALNQIITSRPADQKRKLFADNTKRVYRMR